MKKFHALKIIYGPKSAGATTLLSADGSTLHIDKEAILKRCAEHFNSVLNRPSSINEDEPSVAFGRLRGNVWERNGIKLGTKLKVYKAVVLPTLLYACETWTVYQRHAKRLNHFHLSCLRKLLKIKWQDKIPYTEVLKKAGMQSMHTVLKLAQLRWTGHLIRMPNGRLPKKVFYGELQEGKCSQGGQKKRYKDTLKASLKDFDISTDCTGAIKVARSHQQRSSSL